MRFFFRTKRFKTILGILAAVIVSAVVFSVIGGIMAPGTSIAASLAAPFQKLASSVSRGVSDIYTAFTKDLELMDENEALKEKIAELQGDLVAFEEAQRENEFYKEFLEIKEQNPDFEFSPAMVIASDSIDIYRTFTIDKGSLSGIAAHDPVMTSSGVLGYVSEVSLTTAKVTTILDPTLNIGGYNSRTGDTGIITGDAVSAGSGMTQFYNLPRSSAIAVNDFIITSGGGVFPRGLIIGQIDEVTRSSTDSSVSALIKPTGDLDALRNVMVITYFDGQGSAAESGAK